MSCNCKNCRCKEFLSLFKRYIDAWDDDGSLFPDDDDWANELEDIRDEMRKMILTKD